MPRLAHSAAAVAALREPTAERPWRVLVSGCLYGLGCGVDGTDYGMGGLLADFLRPATVVAVPYCPEEVGLGTPRTMPDLHGGDGFDVVDGAARVLDEHGVDLTEGMLVGARAMLAHALEHAVDFAVLTDMSAACGTQVISDGCRYDEPRRYRQGVGVAAATLLRAGIPVVSQRDHRTLGQLRARAEPGFQADPEAVDHHRTAWVVEHFGG
jgi:uncharacterized protein YbbK (DUF523 family)